MQGRIVKGIAGFYYVDVKETGIVECHAVGKFRKDKEKPLVGDKVELELTDAKNLIGSITGILPRKSMLYRPEVANVSQALVVFAYSSPDPNLGLLDKFLIMLKNHNIECGLCFNKNDIASDEIKEEMAEAYKNSGAKIFSLSALNNDLDQIREFIKGKITVLAGPSGVGKSTLINNLCPEANMETGDISKKLARGKHTTRHSQLFKVDEDTYIMDTPGFTSFELLGDIDKDNLKAFYPEFYPYEGGCRFDPCSHTHEPSCSVKEAVEEGSISRIRYNGYLALYKELQDRRKY